MGNWIPGFRNQIVLDNVVLPVLPGSTFSMPKNYTIPDVFSGNNLFQFVYVEGLQYPMISLNTMVMSNWFTAQKMALWFLTRNGDDVASAGTLQYWDGKRGIQAENCKINVMSIGATSGEPLLRCRLTLLGAGAITQLGAKPSAGTIAATPAAFHHVTLGGGLSTTPGDAKSVASWDLTFSNNLDVCPELNATPYPTEHNSGRLTGTMRLVKQAGANMLADGTACTFTISPPSGTPVTITVHNPLCLDPEERTVQSPRQMREYNYALLGQSPTSAPFSVA